MIGPRHPLVLGSASPRRREILGSLGIPLLVLPADIVEDTEPGETPEAYLERIARGKLEAVAARLATHSERASAAAVLVADTTVVLDGRILGKPGDIAEAGAMLRELT